MDVEGAELGILRGMSGVIERVSPILFVEVHDHLANTRSPSKDVAALLIDRGYDVREVDKMKGESGEIGMKPIEKDSSIGQNSVLVASHSA